MEDEYKEVSTLIKELTALLKSPKKLRQEVETELQGVKLNDGDRRRTQIVSLKKGEVANDLLTITDVTPAQAVWVGSMADGTIGRTYNDEMPRGQRAAGAPLAVESQYPPDVVRGGK